MSFKSRFFNIGKVIWLVLFLCKSVNGQESLADFAFIKVDQNPTQRAITCIVQDNRSNLWLGTLGEGLLKFDGTNFKVYKQDWTNSKSLKSSFISVLYLDAENTLWVGTEEGLYRYHSSSDSFVRIALEGDKKVAVHAISGGASGTLLVGTHQFGLFEVTTAALDFRKIPFEENLGVASLQINAIVAMDENRSLVATNQGLMIYSIKEDRLKKLILGLDKNDTLLKHPVKSLLRDNQNTFWAGTDADGLLKIDFNHTGVLAIENLSITNKRILSLVQSEEGFIFCGTENDGLIVLNSSGETLKNFKYQKTDNFGVKSNSIWTVFADTENRIWLGYYDRGLDVYDQNHSKFKSLYNKNGFPNLTDFNSVTGLALGKDGALWMGISGSGIVVYNPDSNGFTFLNEEGNRKTTAFKSRDIQTVFIDSRETVWIGTWSSGLYFWKRERLPLNKLIRKIQMVR